MGKIIHHVCQCNVKKCYCTFDKEIETKSFWPNSTNTVCGLGRVELEESLHTAHAAQCLTCVQETVYR